MYEIEVTIKNKPNSYRDIIAKLKAAESEAREYIADNDMLISQIVDDKWSAIKKQLAPIFEASIMLDEDIVIPRCEDNPHYGYLIIHNGELYRNSSCCFGDGFNAHWLDLREYEWMKKDTVKEWTNEANRFEAALKEVIQKRYNKMERRVAEKDAELMNLIAK